MESKLRAARRRSGQSLNDVAQKVGVSFVTVSRYERHERKLPVPMAKRLGKLFGVKWETFYEEDGHGETA